MVRKDDAGCYQLMIRYLGIWDARFEDANDCRRPITDATEANVLPMTEGSL